ncbi:PREDICTED: uncharacterized protein LOC108559870 [Nicrophorus vespilloides]|uniref:Uncharacterized protein LOC108559870 n=1 Tax=Nicrophorus vespilloides TaxID=110193 RepID=A0ABM1MDS9_NICVS|nr:PREDICTED: uncharacterized protein LOC108559870 [Nicrophorus vespilloides]
MRLLWLLAALGLAQAGPFKTISNGLFAEDNFRLDEFVKPESYVIELSLKDNFATDKTFTGKTTIVFNVEKETSSIRLHRAEEMDIELANIVLTDDKKAEIKIEKMTYDAVTEIITLILKGDLVKNTKYSLDFKTFKGKLYEDMYGFYLSTYKLDAKKTETIATTQFQATYARRAFPCFDEPQFKAKFTITINHPIGYTALGNQPKIAASTNVKTTFKETVSMSTYIVAFVVSKFEAQPTNNKEMSIWARKEAKETMKFAAEDTPKLVKQLDEYTGIPYLSTKMEQLHQVAIPDFSAGAMENWGLLTYRESALLWDPKESTTKNKQRVSSIMAHEQSHMWFGDLVTMKWWEHAWLNEGFARFFEYFTTGEVHPDWNTMEQFVVEQMHTVFPLDAVTSQPLSNKVDSATEIQSNFGSITYNKGGCIVRMMQHLMGVKEFKKRIQKYLKRNQFEKTVPDDLFRELSNMEDVTEMKNFMKEWIYSPGYPVVSVNYSKGKVLLKQERFVYDKQTTPEKKEAKTIWKIPISYSIEDEADFQNTKPKLNMTGETGEIIVLPKKWIILNMQQTGYYRVNYDGILLGLIHETLKDKKKIDKIDPISRAQLVDDVFNLARGGYKTYKESLDFIGYMKEETSYYPWYTAFNSFSFLRKRLSGSLHTDLTNYMKDLMANVYKSLTTGNKAIESEHIGKLKKTLINQWACEINMGTCVQSSKEQFKKYMEGGAAIEPDMRSVVYCAAVRHGSDKEWEHLFNKFANAKTTASENATIITALGCTNDKKLQEKYLASSIGGTIRKQDAQSVFTAVLTGNPTGVDIALNFMATKFEEIVKSYGGMNSLSNVITSISERITSPEQVKKFEKFLKDNEGKLQDATKDVTKAAIATAETNMKWVKSYEKDLTAWFNTYNGRNSAAGITGSLALVAAFAIISKMLHLPEMILLWLLATLGLVQGGPLNNTSNGLFGEVNDRLDEFVKPESYEIDILLTDGFALKKIFTGKSQIKFNIEKSTNVIRLHKAKELIILDNDIALTDDKTVALGIVNVEYNEDTEILHITIGNYLAIGKYILQFRSFQGTLAENAYGFYLSTYKVDSKNTETFAITQFQPTYARHAFPCFDEPQFKAKFTITVNHPLGYTALGNQPKINTSPSTTIFKETAPMSTYAVAFVVAKFEPIATTHKQMKIWARKEAREFMVFAAEDTPLLVQKLNQFTGIDYFSTTMNQLLQVAIPDYPAGATENWGLLTFSESALLWDPKESTTKNKQRVSSIMAHEQSHMWFGNLVSMKRWEDAWLNKGFARFLEYFITEKVHPDWNMMDQFVVEQMHTVFPLDDVTTQPLSNKVSSSSDIQSNSITYNKGGCIVRMMQHLIGPPEFKMRIQQYLNKNKFSSAVPDDLFRELSSSENVNEMKNMMKEWIYSPGYPVVSVSYSKGRAVLKQERFVYEKHSTQGKKESKTIWKIPITYTTGDNPDFRNTKPKINMTSATTEITIDTKKWIIFNIQQTGYYRVNYDRILLGLIHETLKDKSTIDEIDQINRAQLVDDVLNLARGDYTKYNDSLNFIGYMKEETSYYPWYTAFNSFSFLRKRFSGNLYTTLTNYIKDLMGNVYKSLERAEITTESEHIRKLKKTLVMQWACEINMGDCVKTSKDDFKKYMEGGAAIEPDMRSVVYCAAVRHGSFKEWQFLFEKLASEQSVSSENAKIITALGCTNNTILQQEYLTSSIDGTIRKQDTHSVFTAVLTGNPTGVNIALNFMANKFEEIVKNYEGMNPLSKVITSIAERITSSEQVEKLKKFLRDNEGKLQDATKDATKAAIATAETNMKWVKNHEEEIMTWLNKYNSRNSTAGIAGSLSQVAGFAIISKMLH